MGIISRMGTIIRAKMNDLLNRAEDPRETLEYSYERQLEMLRDVKRGVVDVVTSKRRLELQEARLQDQANKHDEQARRALAAGREDLARMALMRKQEAMQQISGLDSQISDLENEQQKLTTTEQRLSMKIESFRSRKETIKAQYSAAEAQVKIGEAVSGISEEMADVGLAVERAEEKTERLRARSLAIDELVEQGTLEDFTGSRDVVDRELGQITASQNVESELAALKQQMQGGQGQLPGSSGQGQLPAGSGSEEESR
ncbi:MAG: PspA/IM30 family protein [Chloroflexota bacterium]